MLPHRGVNARGHQVEARRWVRLDVPSVARARKVALFWLVRELGPSVVRVGFTVKSLRARVNILKNKIGTSTGSQLEVPRPKLSASLALA